MAILGVFQEPDITVRAHVLEGNILQVGCNVGCEVEINHFRNSEDNLSVYIKT